VVESFHYEVDNFHLFQLQCRLWHIAYA